MRIPLLKILGKKELLTTNQVTKETKRKEKKFQKFLGEAILNLQGNQFLLPDTSNLFLKGKPSHSHPSLSLQKENKSGKGKIILEKSLNKLYLNSSQRLKDSHFSLSLKRNLNEKRVANPEEKFISLKEIKSLNKKETLKIIQGKEISGITQKKESVSSLKDLSLSKIKEKPSLFSKNLENTTPTIFTQKRENGIKNKVTHHFEPSSLSGNFEGKLGGRVNNHPLTQNVVFSHSGEERNLITQIAVRIKFLCEHQDKSEGTIILKPEHMGTLRLHLSIQKADLALNMQTSNPRTGELIQKNLEYLKSSLEKEGLLLKDFTLSQEQNPGFGGGGEQDKNFLHHSRRKVSPIREDIFPEQEEGTIVSEEYHYVNYLI